LWHRMDVAAARAECTSRDPHGRTRFAWKGESQDATFYWRSEIRSPEYQPRELLVSSTAYSLAATDTADFQS
jgi:hypothetical protein